MIIVKHGVYKRSSGMILYFEDGGREPKAVTTFTSLHLPDANCVVCSSADQLVTVSVPTNQAGDRVLVCMQRYV